MDQMMGEESHQADAASEHPSDHLDLPCDLLQFSLRASDYEGQTPSSALMTEIFRILEEAGKSLCLREQQLRELYRLYVEASPEPETGARLSTSKEATYLLMASRLLNSGQQQILTMLSVE